MANQPSDAGTTQRRVISRLKAFPIMLAQAQTIAISQVCTGGEDL